MSGVQGNGTNQAKIPLSTTEKSESARLMRVNHSGEIAARVLYRGPASVSLNRQLRAKFRIAARDEYSHLLWCGHRVAELEHQTMQTYQIRDGAQNDQGQSAERCAAPRVLLTEISYCF
jgi:hypothetical protein